MSSTVESDGMLTVLEIAPLKNGWAAAIILMCPRQLMVRSTLDRVVLFEIIEDPFDLWLIVAQRFQRGRHGAIDDLQHAAAGELLVLDERDVRLDSGRVAVHHEGDRARRREHRGLSISIPVLAARIETLVPNLLSRLTQIIGAARVDAVRGLAVHRHHAEHRLLVLSVTGERADAAGDAAAREIRLTVEQCRDRTRNAATCVAVVRNAPRHQQAAEVRIAQTQWPEQMAVLGDGRSRIARVIDQDFLSGDKDRARSAEAVDVEAVPFTREFSQVDARQIAGRVVEEHVLGARIAGVDAAGVRAGVPAIDRRVVLHARVATDPSARSHLAHHVLRIVFRA
ncbi:MAG: hypothetical protein FD138_4368 [Planctomycetota bacterium]|nr:MAG: hypothetical protein FD138_4368 [Planctomycetota bacterium]